MKKLTAIALAMSCLAAAHAADDAASAPATAPAPATSAPATSASANEAARLARMRPELEGYCLYGSKPSGNAKYTLLKAVKSKRGTYGSVLDELPRFIDEARAAGGDAVIGYNGAQHFGFLAVAPGPAHPDGHADQVGWPRARLCGQWRQDLLPGHDHQYGAPEEVNLPQRTAYAPRPAWRVSQR